MIGGRRHHGSLVNPRIFSLLLRKKGNNSTWDPLQSKKEGKLPSPSKEGATLGILHLSKGLYTTVREV